MKKRGQISIELVITVGFALLLIIPLTILLYDHTMRTYENVNNNQAGLIARKITDTANSVYYLGQPTSTTLKVYMPENIASIAINGREIVFLGDDDSEIVSTANINMSGNLSSSSGLRYIVITAFENYVNLSEDAS